MPEPHEGELQPIHSVSEMRCKEWQRDQLQDLIENEELEVIV
ncbi:hypothetical protein [Synechococcus sp. LTW-R]|nr:hypothetical protein [Synechococcus sp. LTW-R]